MPLITVTYSSSRRVPSLKADIAAAVTELTAGILHKDPKVTAIIVKSVDAADWFAGGKSLAEQSLASFWLDIHVSEGTNTKDEKAAYLAACSSAWASCSGLCTTRAICTSMKSAAMPTASVG
jgi:4-oxalocrotonate tautomerase